MADHGVDYLYKPYCANGNNGDCKCNIAGQSYEDALNDT